jgi:DNA-binding MarR family transcriptional regulator
MKLDNSLGFLLNKAAGEMKYALESALRPYDLTPAQWSVLSRLTSEDGQTISDIGKSLYFDKPTISGIIRRLHDKALVKKTGDPHDQRLSRIYITKKAKELMIELPPLAMGVNKQALQGINQKEAALLNDLLGKILKNMK